MGFWWPRVASPSHKVSQTSFRCPVVILFSTECKELSCVPSIFKVKQICFGGQVIVVFEQLCLRYPLVTGNALLYVFKGKSSKNCCCLYLSLLPLSISVSSVRSKKQAVVQCAILNRTKAFFESLFELLQHSFERILSVCKRVARVCM